MNPLDESAFAPGQRYCKECAYKYLQDHREKHLAASRKYQSKPESKEKERLRRLEYESRPEVIAHRKEYYARSEVKAACYARFVKYREKNPEKYKAYQKDYKDKQREKKRLEREEKERQGKLLEME